MAGVKSESGNLPINAGIDKVKVNKADATELKRLPSVGDATAENIIRYRQENGNIRDIQTLITIKFVKVSNELLNMVDFELDQGLTGKMNSKEEEFYLASPCDFIITTSQSDQDTKDMIHRVDNLVKIKHNANSSSAVARKHGYTPFLASTSAQLVPPHLSTQTVQSMSAPILTTSAQPSINPLPRHPMWANMGMKPPNMAMIGIPSNQNYCHGMPPYNPWMPYRMPYQIPPYLANPYMNPMQSGPMPWQVGNWQSSMVDQLSPSHHQPRVGNWPPESQRPQKSERSRTILPRPEVRRVEDDRFQWQGTKPRVADPVDNLFRRDQNYSPPRRNRRYNVGDEVRPQPQNVDRDANIPIVNPPQDQPHRDNPRHVDGAPMIRDDQLPKGLKYDGKENWLGFKNKFNRYYQVRQWTPDEARDNLCWCLEGKASEFYATVVAQNQNIGFVELLTKLEKRFGGVQFPDTAQVQLSNSKQKPDESTKDWADRVLQLSVRAFPDLPEE
jgi:hypothetical protein